MKLSVSLPDEDVEFLDAYGEQHEMPSRSATLQRAVQLLRASELGAAYEGAWSEWDATPEASWWAGTSSDGIDS